MLWRPETIQDIADKLVQLGLERCSVCGSGTQLQTDRRPVVLSVGGPAWIPAEPAEPSTNILFMVRIFCDACGQTLLFDSERFFDGDHPTLERG